MNNQSDDQSAQSKGHEYEPDALSATDIARDDRMNEKFNGYEPDEPDLSDTDMTNATVITTEEF